MLSKVSESHSTTLDQHREQIFFVYQTKKQQERLFWKLTNPSYLWNKAKEAKFDMIQRVVMSLTLEISCLPGFYSVTVQHQKIYNFQTQLSTQSKQVRKISSLTNICNTKVFLFIIYFGILQSWFHHNHQ